MKLNAIVVGATLIALGACSSAFRLYPVRGPWPAGNPVPILHGAMRPPNPGTITLELPDGEVLTGKWSSAPATSPEANLGALWDEIYGATYFTARVLGQWNHGTAVLTGPKGSRVQLDFLFGRDNPTGLGVAKDAQGGVYKVLL